MAAKPTAYALSDGTVRYKVRFRLVPGKNPTSEGGFTTLEEAQKFARLVDAVGGPAAKEMRRASTDAPLDVPTLRSYLETYLTRLEAHATPGTIAGYRRDATRTWLRRLGDLPVDQITRDAVIAWVAWQRQQETQRSRTVRKKAITARKTDPTVTVPEPATYAAKSVANAQRLLSQVLADAVDDGHITKNPAKGVRLPSDDATRGRVYITPDEFTLIYAQLPEHWRPLIATMYGTGMRWGEVTALHVADVDLDRHHGSIMVRRAWKKGAHGVYLGSPKSRRANRTIDIEDPLLPLLRTHVAGRKPDDLVFTAPGGGMVRSQNFHPRVWHPAISAAGIGKRPDLHSLRHSHASNLIRDGVPLPVIQRRLGHESIQTTIDVYGHLAPDSYAGAARSAAVSLAGALPQLEG